MKRNRIKTISVLIGLLAAFLHTATLYGQDVTLSPAFPPAVPQTPEVTRLIGMLKYPVSYNTGLVKTEIPIYEIKLASGYTLPIKLVYQSSGFKPGERSFVGAGWSLVAEPQIAHAVNGLPDEQENVGLYRNRGLNVHAADTLLDAAYGKYDVEPDQYFYLLPHKGGSFFLNRPASNNTVKEFVTVPHDPIRIRNSANLKSFNITDTDGVQYNFVPMEETQTFSSGNDQRTEYVSVYKANSICTPNQEVISFSYEGVNATSPFQYTLHNREQSATLEIKSWNQYQYMIPYCYGQEDINSDTIAQNDVVSGVKLLKRDAYGQTFPTDIKVTINKVHRGTGDGPNPLTEMCDYSSTNFWEQTIRSRYLSRISFPGGSVEFTYVMLTPYENAQKVLSAIQVKDGEGRVVKRFELKSELLGTRPVLMAVRQMSKDGTRYREYSFAYWNRIGVAYDTPAVNAWGYYTGRSNQQTEIPALQGTFALYSDIGEVNDSIHFSIGHSDYYDSADALPGLNFMLKSVTYPTGGRTEFEYERNLFEESRRRMAVSNGSLRIKEIRDYQPDGVLASRRFFKYGKNELGIGLPVRVLEDSDFMTSSNQVIYTTDSLTFGWIETYHLYKLELHARPVVNDLLDASASIVYDQVAEYRDEQGTCGKTVYEYDYSRLVSIRTSRTGNLQPLAPVWYNQCFRKFREWSVGQLVRKSVYDGVGNLLCEERNTYMEVPGAQVTCMVSVPTRIHDFKASNLHAWETIRQLKLGQAPTGFASGNPETYLYDGRISFTSGYMLLTSTERKEYDQGKVFTSRVRYDYNADLLPIRTRRLLEDGSERVDSLFYPKDFADTVSQAMVGANLIRPVVRTVTRTGDARYDVYTPYRISSGIPVVDRIETGKGTQPREVRVRFSEYDNRGNLLEAVKDGSHRVAYLRSATLPQPVAVLEGYDSLSVKGRGETLDYADSLRLESHCTELRNSLRGTAAVTSYTYSPLEGISSITSPAGQKRSFGYNGFGDLILEADGQGNAEKSYTYNYRNQGTVYPLQASISGPAQAQTGTQTFRMNVTSGNGGYLYTWELTGPNNLQYTLPASSSPVFTYEFTVVGTYSLSCQVTDSSGQAVEDTFTFHFLEDLSVCFTYMNHFVDGSEQFMEAEFDCPAETDITFVLDYDTDSFKGTTYYITDSSGQEHKFVRTGQGQDAVTVHLPKGRVRIYIVCNLSDPSCGLVAAQATNGVTLKYPHHINLDMF